MILEKPLFSRWKIENIKIYALLIDQKSLYSRLALPSDIINEGSKTNHHSVKPSG
jgi:hypothetical protein